MKVVTFRHLFQVKKEYASKSIPQYKYNFFKYIALKNLLFFSVKIFTAAHLRHKSTWHYYGYPLQRTRLLSVFVHRSAFLSIPSSIIPYHRTQNPLSQFT